MEAVSFMCNAGSNCCGEERFDVTNPATAKMLHLRIVDGKDVWCPKCSEAFKKKRKLRVHKARMYYQTRQSYTTKIFKKVCHIANI